MNIEVIINAVGDFMITLSSVSSENPAIGFCILIFMPLLLVGGAIIKSGR